MGGGGDCRGSLYPLSVTTTDLLSVRGLLLYPLFTRNVVSYPLSARRNGVSVIGIEHPYLLST